MIVQTVAKEIVNSQNIETCAVASAPALDHGAGGSRLASRSEVVLKELVVDRERTEDVREKQDNTLGSGRLRGGFREISGNAVDVDGFPFGLSRVLH